MSATPDVPVPEESRRPRMLARWIAVVLILGLVAALVAAGERAAAPSQATHDVERYFPLDVGNTWVYESRSGDAEPTTKVTQVIGRAVIADQPGQPTAAIVETRGYDGDTSRGISYYVPRPDGLYVPISRDIRQTDSVPDFPVLKEPLEVGASWTFAGEVYGLRISSSSTTVDRFEDVTVAGVEAADCLVTTTRFDVNLGGTDYPVTGTTWNCPGIGQVKATSVSEDLGLDLTDELVAFSVGGRSSATEEVAAADEEAGAGAAEAPGGGVGLDPGRSNSLDRTPDLSTVAWADSRIANPTHPPVGNGEAMVLGEDDGTLSAVDHRTGEVWWRVGLSGRILTSPTIAGGVVVAEDAAKTVTALDLRTGRTMWRRSFPDLASAPALAVGGLAIVPFHDRVIRALRLVDGSVAWEVRTEGLVVTPPAMAEGLAVVADDDGGILALRVEDGSEAWTGAIALRSDGGPAVRDDLLVLADQDSTVSGIDARTGELRWEVSLPDFAEEPVAIGPDEVVVHVEEGKVFSLDPDDGSTRWTTELGRAENAPMVAGDEVLILTEDSRLHRLDRATGRPLGTVEVPVPGDRGLSDTQLDVAAFGGVLVVAVDADEPLSNPYVAYRVDGEATSGVTVDVTLRPIYPPVDVTGPRAEPRPLGPDLVFPDYASVVWAAPTDRSAPLRELYRGSTVPWAVPAGDVVLVQDEQRLLAVPAAGGEPRWTFQMGDPFPEVTPAVADGRVFVPIDGGGVTALDLATGEELWHEGPPGIGRAAPIVVGDAVVSANGGLSAYEVASGELRWRIEGVEGFAPMATDHGVVFASLATDTELVLLAVDVASGRELWRVPFDGPVFIGLAASASTVVGIESSGTVRAFDAATGEERWRLRLRTHPNGAPQVLGDVVAVADEGLRELFTEREYRVTFLDLETGRYLGSYEPSGTAAQLPVFTSVDGSIVMYDVGFLLGLEVVR
jgi:outer membrane protein assembly factor BamB